MADIFFTREGGLAKVVLDRPAALNALTLEMCQALEASLRAWERDETVAAILIRGAGGKAFCAGGDIRRLAEAARAGDDYPGRFWSDEYRLNALIKHLTKPYVAIIDGIAMGGGVGLSVHGSHRIASEHALFAMPETGIGFFPDVGASYFLPRCPGRVGLYLGLTGARLKAADMIHADIATHFVRRANLDGLEAALAQSPGDIAGVLARFAEHPGPSSLAEDRPEIDRYFSEPSLETVLAALEASSDEFARRVRDALAGKSPTSLALAFRELRLGESLAFDDCMRLEWRIASRVPRHLPDFLEGVRAIIVDKDSRPRWSPARLADVDPDAIEDFFAPAEGGELPLY
jgi:enoyl-CoA hydratase